MGNRIRQLREEGEWTQERLGELAGPDRKTINRIEVAAYSTSIDDLAMAARALRTSVADLVRDA